MNTKALLRTEMRGKIRAQSDAERARASRKITARLQQFLKDSLPELKRVTVFLATEREPNLDTFAHWIQGHGGLILAPHSWESAKPFTAIARDWSNISLNPRGWREPVETPDSPPYAASEMDVILVPALAFDSSGARLGQGGGWYDRALADLPPDVLTIGIAFDFQIIESVPREVHDQNIDLIITDQRIIKTPVNP